MTMIEKAKKLRPYIEKAVALALTDKEGLEAVELFPNWSATNTYEINDRVKYFNILYKCLQAHTAQEAWTPIDAPSLWAKVLIPDENIIPAWEQPDSTNPYNTGDKVLHNEQIWISIIDGNVWEPGEYGWEIVE